MDLQQQLQTNSKTVINKYKNRNQSIDGADPEANNLSLFIFSSFLFVFLGIGVLDKKETVECTNKRITARTLGRWNDAWLDESAAGNPAEPVTFMVLQGSDQDHPWVTLFQVLASPSFSLTSDLALSLSAYDHDDLLARSHTSHWHISRVTASQSKKKGLNIFEIKVFFDWTNFCTFFLSTLFVWRKFFYWILNTQTHVMT